ncbi:MAG TPA: AmmeMemoRadiSam system protein A [Pyrinomonadaceae bacterium]|jgi:AmmeMemoRadiSam system protein A
MSRSTEPETRAEDSQEESLSSDAAALTALARAAVETYVGQRRVLEAEAAPASPLLRERAACFVSIKTHRGDLRGCIGTIEPSKPTLVEELITNAISAATRDPRFFPVAEGELAELRYSVDVLSAPEPTRFEDLDPKTYGLIVEDERGAHRGLLLPDIEGVETSAQQVEIAARKAGIPPGSQLKLFRFRVRRFSEPARSQTNNA